MKPLTDEVLQEEWRWTAYPSPLFVDMLLDHYRGEGGLNVLFDAAVRDRVKHLQHAEEPEFYRCLAQLAKAGAPMRQFEASLKRGRIEHGSAEIFRGITHEELIATYYPPPQWAVHNLFPEGCVLLAGKPKHGKSYLMMSVAYAIAKRQLCLGQYVASAGHVLYFSLEDYAPRIQARVMRAFPTLNTSPYSVEWIYSTRDKPIPTISNGFVELLRRTLTARSDVRLVVVDTLRCIRDISDNSYNLYQEDSNAIGELNACAQDQGVTIVLVHHTRKQKSEDIFDEINGTAGLRGASSANMVLQETKGDFDAYLYAEGKDFEHSLKIALKRVPETGDWVYVGEGEAIEAKNNRTLILRAIRDLDKGNAKAVWESTGIKSYGTVRSALSRMASLGEVGQTNRGEYFVLLGENDEGYVI